MKKQNLSELFSKLDLPARELPELYSKEEISYRSIQKKVAAKIKCMETIENKPESSKNTKRFLLGFGIAAAVLAGGAGALTASNAGKSTREEETKAAIDSSLMEIELEGQYAERSEDPYELPPFYECSDVYDCEVTNTMDGVEVEEVKYFCRNSNGTNNIFVYFHLTSDGSVDFSMLPTDFINSFDVFNFSAKYNSGGYSFYMVSDETDSDDLYLAVECDTRYVDPLENEYKFSLKALLREGYERITELGLKNLMGFTNAEINAGKDFTDEMKDRIENEFNYVNGYYYHKEDVLTSGNMTITVNISEKDLDIDNSYINAVIDEYDKDFGNSVEEDTIEEINAEMIGARHAGTTTEILVRFTPDNGYMFTGGEEEFILKDEKAEIYIIDPETGLKKPVDTKAMRCRTYKDLGGITYGGIPCIYQNFTFITEQAADVYFRLYCGNIIDPETNSVISDGEIRLKKYIGETAAIWYTDARSFTADTGSVITAELSGNELRMTCPGGNPVNTPDYLNSSTGDEKLLTLVTKDGWSYPVKMILYKNKDGSPAAAGTLLTFVHVFKDIDRIEYNGEIIFTP